VRQLITGIKILPDKGEGIVGFYAFPQVNDSLLLVKPTLARANEMQRKVNKSRLSAIPDFLGAEGGICTFAEIFRSAKIMKRFSCETGVTLETISLNQVG